jgi:hypothetical protein
MSPSDDARLQGALEACEAGRFDDAAALCDALLADQPAHAPAWHVKGIVGLASGQPALALSWRTRPRGT